MKTKFKIQTTLKEMEVNYDWQQIWNTDGQAVSNLSGTLSPEAVPPGSSVDCSELRFEDIAKLLGSVDGENDSSDWLCVVKMKDKRFAVVRAGCDYTGWDCQSNGASCVAATLKDLVKFGLSDSERSRILEHTNQLNLHRNKND